MYLQVCQARGLGKFYSQRLTEFKVFENFIFLEKVHFARIYSSEMHFAICTRLRVREHIAEIKCWPESIKIECAQRKIQHLAWVTFSNSWSTVVLNFKTFLNLGGPAGGLGHRKVATPSYMACRDEIHLSRRAILFYSRRKSYQKS